MCRAAVRPHISLVERYIDGAELSEDLVGYPFDVVAGKASFRVGARPDERADVTVEMTAAAARALTVLVGADPNYPATRDDCLSTAEMRVDGGPFRWAVAGRGARPGRCSHALAS